MAAKEYQPIDNTLNFGKDGTHIIRMYCCQSSIFASIETYLSAFSTFSRVVHELIANFHKKHSKRHFFLSVFRGAWKMGWDIIMDDRKFSFDSCAWRLSIFSTLSNLTPTSLDTQWTFEFFFFGLAGLHFTCTHKTLLHRHV